VTVDTPYPRARVRGTEDSEVPELRAMGRNLIVVELDGMTRGEMEREAEDVLYREGEFVETGGWLYALEPLRAGRVALVKATGPGPAARRGMGLAGNYGGARKQRCGSHTSPPQPPPTVRGPHAVCGIRAET
jgi:hypothetical protein